MAIKRPEKNRAGSGLCTFAIVAYAYLNAKMAFRRARCIEAKIALVSAGIFAAGAISIRAGFGAVAAVSCYIRIANPDLNRTL